MRGGISSYKRRALLLAILLTFLFTPLFLNPNPFGNYPDAIKDESLFLNTSLAAFEHRLPPGLDFTQQGAYYGGPLVYIVTVALLPLVSFQLFAAGFDITLLKYRVANNIGEMVHAVRLTNGLLVLCGLLAVLYLFLIKKDEKIRLGLAFLVVFTLANPLFVGMAHTGKIWVLQMLLELAAGVAVWLQYTTKKNGDPILSSVGLSRLLIWLSALSALQSVVGVFTGLWLVYSFVLGLIDRRDLWQALKKDWIWLSFLVLANIAFLYRGYLDYLRMKGGITNLSISQESSFAARLIWPINILLKAHPTLVAAWLVLSITWAVKRFREAKPIFIIIAHPIIIYFLYYPLLGFGSFPRYVLPLTVALTLACLFAFDAVKKLSRPVVIIGLLLAVLVCGKTAWLFWQPSSNALAAEYITNNMNNQHATIIISGSSTLELPMNTSSLALLDERNLAKTRYLTMRQMPTIVEKEINFLPIITFSTSGPIALRALSSTQPVWQLDNNCQELCAHASPTIECLSWNERACSIHTAYVHEVTTLSDLFETEELGPPMFLRRLR